MPSLAGANQSPRRETPDSQEGGASPCSKCTGAAGPAGWGSEAGLRPAGHVEFHLPPTTAHLPPWRVGLRCVFRVRSARVTSAPCIWNMPPNPRDSWTLGNCTLGCLVRKNGERSVPPHVPAGAPPQVEAPSIPRGSHRGGWDLSCPLPPLPCPPLGIYTAMWDSRRPSAAYRGVSGRLPARQESARAAPAPAPRLLTWAEISETPHLQHWLVQSLLQPLPAFSTPSHQYHSPCLGKRKSGVQEPAAPGPSQ